MSHQSPGIEMRHEARSWLSKGYGIAPQLLMMDRRLSIGAKALFCYISSIAGSAPNPEFGGPASWPTRERICADLGINKDTFTRYLRELREFGYIRVEQKRVDGEKFGRNVYIICEFVDSTPPSPDQDPCPNKSDTVAGDPCPKKPDTEKPDTEKPDTENPDTTNNRSTNNTLTKTRRDKTDVPSRRVLSSWEIYLERPPSPTERRILGRLEREYGTEWVDASFQEYLVQSDKQEISAPIRYIEGVLRNWRVEGMRLTDILAHLRRMKGERG